MTVSAFRTITLGAASGSIYGVLPVQPMLRWPLAEPGAVLDYSLDVTALLADVDDEIAFASLAVSPWGTGELVVSSLDVEGGVITAWLGPGFAGRNYTIRIDALTTAVRTFEYFIGLLIDPSQAPYPLPVPPNIGFGTPLTWGGNPRTLDFSKPANSGLLVLL